jgi:hypothetical protein
MTRAHRARVLYDVLQWAPMVRSKLEFKRYADAGDVEGLWAYYQKAMKVRGDIKRSVEASGSVSFERLRPAMEAIYGLPTSD